MTMQEHYAVTKTRMVWKCDLCMRTIREEKSMVRMALRHVVSDGGIGGKTIANVTQWHLCWRCAFELEDRMQVMRNTRGAGLTSEEQEALLHDIAANDNERQARSFWRRGRK